MKKKILFFHFDLGGGGAEKVLVNLVNNLDPDKYDITLYTVFNRGVYKDSFAKHIKRKTIFNKQFRGFITMAKLLSPSLLHKLFIREKYDMEIAFYHRFPARVISGCNNKKIKTYAWVHSGMVSPEDFFTSFRSVKEGKKAYYKFDRIAFVAQTALESFVEKTGWADLNCKVIHNAIDTNDIIEKSKVECDLVINRDILNICSVGRLSEEKGYRRLIKSLHSIKECGYDKWHFYLLGQGSEELKIKEMISNLGLDDHISLLGFKSNPYKYVRQMDLFVCPSYVEGYSTAVVESIIVGTPVLTTDCSGMKEILDDEAGLIVDNNDDSLYDGIKQFLQNGELLSKYKIGAKHRGDLFSIDNAIKEFEDFIGE